MWEQLLCGAQIQTTSISAGQSTGQTWSTPEGKSHGDRNLLTFPPVRTNASHRDCEGKQSINVKSSSQPPTWSTERTEENGVLEHAREGCTGTANSQRLRAKLRRAKTKQMRSPKVVKNLTLPKRGTCYPKSGESTGARSTASLGAC